jgi:hypothetical protein
MLRSNTRELVNDLESLTAELVEQDRRLDLTNLTETTESTPDIRKTLEKVRSGERPGILGAASPA